jgi:hypothetical protein
MGGMEGRAGVWPSDGVAVPGPTGVGLSTTVGLPAGVGLRVGVGTRVAVTTEGRGISGETSCSGRICGPIPMAANDVGRTPVVADCDSVDEPGSSRSAGRRVGTALPRPSAPNPPMSPPTPHPRIRETASTRAAKRHLSCLGLGSHSSYSCRAPDFLLFLNIYVSVIPPVGYLLR